ncbi:uncharacterized protein DSM5745_09778 [Aspergillus mulundensis]|uniref:Uncharacterized protein n=1 Tax=Aspergillus mulundensis TaxID=1810919 RepID=A0A3D8QRG2_9EURO|nr:hypothetical protein DSM5745_09778 [Aspergillus mulundensis]RDW64367.1 hypothetical protein DSM5745_09778 [Aspergillus mulundensis]
MMMGIGKKAKLIGTVFRARRALNQRIAILEFQIQEMSAEKEKSDRKIRRLTGTIYEQEDTARKDATELHQQDEIIERLQEDLSRLEGQQRHLEAMVIGQQEDALQSLVTNKWHAPKEDRYVRDELSKLNDKLRQWARNNSMATFSDTDSVALNNKNTLVELLSGYCACNKWATLINKIPAPKDRIPALLVQAALAKDLSERLFIDPFFAFDAIELDKSVPGPEQMRTLQSGMAKVQTP